MPIIHENVVRVNKYDVSLVISQKAAKTRAANNFFILETYQVFRIKKKKKHRKYERNWTKKFKKYDNNTDFIRLFVKFVFLWQHFIIIHIGLLQVSCIIQSALEFVIYVAPKRDSNAFFLCDNRAELKHFNQK